jgi:MbtH protein
MTSLFDNKDGTFLVLVNDEGQHSLWPSVIKVPLGWRVALEQSTYGKCLDFVNDNWTDMRPRSLVQKMEGNER